MKNLFTKLLLAAGIMLGAATQVEALTVINQTGKTIRIKIKSLPSGPTYNDSSLANGLSRTYDDDNYQVIFGTTSEYISYLPMVNGVPSAEKKFYPANPDADPITILPN